MDEGEKIEKEVLGDVLWKKLVKYCPEYKRRKICRWQTFRQYLFDEMDEDDVIRFLKAYPDRMDCFLVPYEDDDERWYLPLSEEGWVKFLETEAWAARYCESSVLKKVLPKQKWSGMDWVNNLMRDCRFAESCDWSALSGGAWVELLENYPEYADKCDWEKLDGADWAELLAWKPQFADRYDWAKLLSDKGWGCLYKRQPQFRSYRRRWLKANGGISTAD